jgi:hypothetical protein
VLLRISGFVDLWFFDFVQLIYQLRNKTAEKLLKTATAAFTLYIQKYVDNT